MKFPTMFSPIQIGTVTVPNRFVVPPMGNNFANTDGTLSDRSLAYYTARAKGGFGLITIESAVVYEEAKGGPRKPCLFTDDTVKSFRKVADACHSYGARVSIQLQYAGPEGNSRLTGYPLKAASRMAAAQGREAELTPADKKKKVVVVGGGMVGCEAAEYLAERGHQVGIIEMKDVIAGDVTEGSLRGFDNVVLAMGSRANGALKETAEKVAGQVLVIGEAAKAPGNAVVAVNDAFEAALQI